MPKPAAVPAAAAPIRRHSSLDSTESRGGGASSRPACPAGEERASSDQRPDSDYKDNRWNVIPQLRYYIPAGLFFTLDLECARDSLSFEPKILEFLEEKWAIFMHRDSKVQT